MKKSTLFKAEWSHLLKSRMLRITCGVILFIPILYGGFFLGSIWNPYGKTSNLPVVVVNQDQGATLDGRTVHVGNQLVDNLKKNHNLDWHFTSHEAAETGMNANTYYMMVTIPKDFSKNATTITSQHPTKSVIHYELATSKNYIGSVVNEQAMSKLQSTVSTELSKTYVTSLFSQLALLQNGLQQASNGAGQLQTGAETAQAGSQSLSDGVSQYTAGVGQLGGGQTQLGSGLAQLQQGTKQLEAGLAQANAKLPSEAQISQLKQASNEITAGLATLNASTNPSVSSQSIQPHVEAIGSAAQSIGSSLGDLQTLAEQVSTSGASTAEKTQMEGLIQSIASSQTTQLGVISHQLDATKPDSLVSVLNQQAATVHGATQQLSTGMTTLNTGSQAAFNGYNELRGGVSQLQTGAHSLGLGILSAQSGSNQLLGGINTLNSRSPELQSGVSQLHDGLGQLAAGNETLKTNLASAATQLSLQPTSAAIVDQIATPVTTKKTTRGNVPNYGYALAPYVLSLGLFVGALTFNVIYPLRRNYGKIRNKFDWWFAKFSMGFAIGTLQAFVMVAIMTLGLGLHPANLPQFMLIACLSSWAYMAIIMFFYMSLGNPGLFLSMILLVLQLGGSGGTFPLQLSNHFFQAINPYLPMSYSILSFRQAISSGLGVNAFWTNLGVLAIYMVVFNFLLWALLAIRGKRRFAPQEEQYN